MVDRTAQDIANSVGSNLRAVEAALASNDVTAATSAAQALHADLNDGFAFLDQNTDLDLDWDQIAGNDGSAEKGAHTDGGVKTKPE